MVVHQLWGKKNLLSIKKGDAEELRPFELMKQLGMIKSNQINVLKTYYRTNKGDNITAPIIEQSLRTIDISKSLRNGILDYCNLLYKYPHNVKLDKIKQA